MPDKPSDIRFRRRTPRRGNGSGPRQFRSGRGRRDQTSSGGGRLSREQLEWARDLWEHREGPETIADQLGIELSDAQALVSHWEKAIEARRSE